MLECFSQWSILKERFGNRKLIVFISGEDCLFINDDAIEVVTVLGIEKDLVFGPDGAYVKLPASSRAFFAKRIERSGWQLVYADTTTPSHKIRLPANVEVGRDRVIDEATGRVYLGRNGVGSFWYDSKRGAIYMRHSDSRWLGQFCQPSEWANVKAIEHLPLPV